MTARPSHMPSHLPAPVDESTLRPSGQIGASANERAEHFELGGSEDTAVVMTTVQAMANWSRKNSIWPLPLGLSCCGIEFMSVAASRFDMSRFGMEVARFSPRQADLMLVAGTLTYKMAQAMTRLYDQMSEPKWVIAMGACASSGGMFRSYPVVQGIDEFIPVDFYIPGCPPRPEAVLECLIQLQKRIERDRSYRIQVRRSHLPPFAVPAPTVLPRAGREPAPPVLSSKEERYVEPAPHAEFMRVLPSKEVV